LFIILTNRLTCISKPETAEKLLSRINDSPLRDQVISAILESYTLQKPSNNSPDSHDAYGTPDFTVEEDFGSDDVDIPDTSQTPCPCVKLKRESPVVSPLQIMAGAFAATMSPPHQCLDSQSHVSLLAPISQDSNANTVDTRLVEYFCMFSVAFDDNALYMFG
jgi:hypothetical protein